MVDVPSDLERILGPNEAVELYIKQNTCHPKINIDSVARDKGITRSTIRCTLRIRGEPLALNDLPNSEAEKVYGIIRENLARYYVPFPAGYTATPPYRQEGEEGQGESISDKMCSKCGAKIAAEQKFCGNCGKPLQNIIHP